MKNDSRFYLYLAEVKPAWTMISDRIPTFWPSRSIGTLNWVIPLQSKNWDIFSTLWLKDAVIIRSGYITVEPLFINDHFCIFLLIWGCVRLVHSLKFLYSEKAIKIWCNLPRGLEITFNEITKTLRKIASNLCGLLRKPELYTSHCITRIVSIRKLPLGVFDVKEESK